MDSFSSFLSSLDIVATKSKKTSKSDVKIVETFVKPKSKFCGPKLLTQEVPRDHNYNKKLDMVEMFNSFPCVDNNATEKLDADSSGEDSPQDLETYDNFPSESSLHQASREKSQAMLSREKVEQHQDRFGSDRKRNLVNDDAFPEKKKLNVGGIFSLEPKPNLKKANTVEDIAKGLDHKMDNEKYPQEECIINPSLNADARTSLLQKEVSSVKLVNGRSIDFRCTVCKELPRQLNRSELYRHYANYHFQSNLNDLFGHLKVCPYCDLDLRNVSAYSHFGQKHSFVENFLPTEAWIPLTPSGAKISKTFLKTGSRTSNSSLNKSDRILLKKLGQVKNNEDLPFEALWVWPEIPGGCNPDGKVRGSDGGFTNFQQSTILANVVGFDIEIKKDKSYTDECCEQEDFVEHSGEPSLSPSAHEQVFQCRICKMKFVQKQLAVLHVQSVHVMKGSGDVFHDYDVLLRTGYLAQETSSSTVCAASVELVNLCQDTAVEDEAQSMELIEE